jgi:hypothetical protein
MKRLGLRDRLAIVAGVRSVMVGLGLLKSVDEDNVGAGAAVRKYARAFTDTARQRTAKNRRIAAVPDDDGSDDVA